MGKNKLKDDGCPFQGISDKYLSSLLLSNMSHTRVNKTDEGRRTHETEAVATFLPIVIGI